MATQAQAAADPDSGLRVAVGVHADQGSGALPQSMPTLVGVTHGIASQAAPGEVVASDTVVRQARASTRIAYGRRTSRRIDGVADPLGLVRVESGSGSQQAESGRRRNAVALFGGGAAVLAGLAWLAGSGGFGPSSSPTPARSIAAASTPSPTPAIVERIAYSAEETVADTDACGIDFGGLEAHLRLVTPEGLPELPPATDMDDWARAPDWSADGTTLGFWGNLQSGDDVPFVTSPSGRGQVQLAANDPNTGGQFYGGVLPAVSSDGSQVAIAKDGSLVVFDVSARSLKTVLGAPWGSQGSEPAPSPVAAGPKFVAAVDWLTDGRLALQGDGAFWTAAADGSGAQHTGTLPELGVWYPRWSPDGSRVIFQSRPVDANDNPSGPWDIYVVDADGAGLTQLTTDPGNDIQPTWSPDGSRIAFSSDRDGAYEIYTMAADGSEPVADHRFARRVRRLLASVGKDDDRGPPTTHGKPGPGRDAGSKGLPPWEAGARPLRDR